MIHQLELFWRINCAYLKLTDQRRIASSHWKFAYRFGGGQSGYVCGFGYQSALILRRSSSNFLTLQFADYFLTAIIDKIPFVVKHGEMPTKFQLPNSEHYIRFSVLPNHITPGKVFIRDMVRTNLHPNLVTPPLLSEQTKAISHVPGAHQSP